LAPALARDLPLLDAFAVLRAEVDLEVEAELERPDLEVELRREVELRPLLPARDCDLDPREREDPPPFDVLAGRAMSVASVHRCRNAYPGVVSGKRTARLR